MTQPRAEVGADPWFSPALLVPALLAAVLALTGCSSTEEPAPAPTSAVEASTSPTSDDVTETSAESTTTQPEPDAAPYFDGAAEMGCIADDTLDDGRWFGFVPDDGVDVDAGTIDFDLACWFAGPDADAAGEARGEEVTNDYLIVNDNDQLRTIPASMTAAVTFFPSGDPSDVSVMMLRDWLTARSERGFEMGVWVEIEGGTVTKVEERWVP